jgi:hypothetical protein
MRDIACNGHDKAILTSENVHLAHPLEILKPLLSLHIMYYLYVGMYNVKYYLYVCIIQ